jgi:peptide/nickel transport system substrate-binding protein
MKKVCLIFVLVILVSALILVGCTPTKQPGSTASPAVASPTASGNVNPPVAPNTVSRTIKLDPSTVDDADSVSISSDVYDGLIRLDASGTPQAALATKWTVSDDQLDYVIELRQNVTFHGGDPFNADVVLDNFNRWFDPTNPLHGTLSYPGWTKYFLGFKGDLDSSGMRISSFDGIEKVDEHTVLIHLNRPMPEFIADLASPYFLILNPSLLASGGTAFGTSAKTTDGTGPYFVSSWTDAGLVLTPNSNYWGGAPVSVLNISWK